MGEEYAQLFAWLKYLSAVQDREGVSLVKHTFPGHGMSTQYYTIKIQIIAVGRSEISTANRDGSPLDYSEQPPS